MMIIQLSCTAPQIYTHNVTSDCQKTDVFIAMPKWKQAGFHHGSVHQRDSRKFEDFSSLLDLLYLWSKIFKCTSHFLPFENRCLWECIFPYLRTWFFSRKCLKKSTTKWRGNDTGFDFRSSGSPLLSRKSLDCNGPLTRNRTETIYEDFMMNIPNLLSPEGRQ